MQFHTYISTPHLGLFCCLRFPNMSTPVTPKKIPHAIPQCVVFSLVKTCTFKTSQIQPCWSWRTKKGLKNTGWRATNAWCLKICSLSELQRNENLKTIWDGAQKIWWFFVKFRLRCWKMHFICSKKERRTKMCFLPQKEASTKHYREKKTIVDGRNPAAVDR